MKLIRFGEAGTERPGVVLDDGPRLDVLEMSYRIMTKSFSGSRIEGLGEAPQCVVISERRYSKTV
jgi:hypothetical protein